MLLTDAPAATRPPRWKMAIITWVSIFPIVSTLAYAIAPLQMPLVVNIAASTAVSVATVTWVVMPRLTRVLHRWLNAP